MPTFPTYLTGLSIVLLTIYVFHGSPSGNHGQSVCNYGCSLPQSTGELQGQSTAAYPFDFGWTKTRSPGLAHFPPKNNSMNLMRKENITPLWNQITFWSCVTTPSTTWATHPASHLKYNLALTLERVMPSMRNKMAALFTMLPHQPSWLHICGHSLERSHMYGRLGMSLATQALCRHV